MAACIETELKLAASPAMLSALRSHPALAGAETTCSLVSTYYDTPDRRLHRAGALLRLRMSADGPEQTLKLPGTAARRGEWSVALRVGSDAPDPALFPRLARQRLEALVDGVALLPVATTRIQRTTRQVHHNGALIEIAFDHGTLEAGARQVRSCELELELREGRFASLCDLALALPLGPELGWSSQSKAARAFALMDAGPASATAPLPQSPAPRIAAGASVAQGFRVIGWAGLDRLVELAPHIVDPRHGGTPEAVHQARVAIRRLLVAIDLFRPWIEDADLPLLRAELKAAARALGAVRDIDVLLARLASRANETPDRALDDIRAALARRRSEALEATRTVLRASGFQKLLITLARWIEEAPGIAAADARPLGPFARKCLDRWARRVIRSGRDLDTLSDAELHRLRIRAKKWRYAADALASAFPGHARAKAREQRQLSRLQDSLGELHDRTVADATHTALFAQEPPIEAAGLVTRLGQATDGDPAERRDLLRHARKALRRLRRQPRWWRD